MNCFSSFMNCLQETNNLSNNINPMHKSIYTNVLTNLSGDVLTWGCFDRTPFIHYDSVIA